MAATILSAKIPRKKSAGRPDEIIKKFTQQLGQDYPDFKFKSGAQDNWSPGAHTITFNKNQPAAQIQQGILHELAHAVLGHKDYQSDFELLKMESEAWELTVKMSKKYHVKVDQDHVQNCLDTYRDWLHQRSTCPKCGMHVLQKDSGNYQCFNCRTRWHVTSERFVRPYRKTTPK
jgi:hypothetical protein